MNKNKAFKELIVSPKGEVNWCSLVPEEDYNKTGKQFSCRLRWKKNDPEYKKFQKKLDDLATRAYDFFQADEELKVILKKQMVLERPYTPEYDKEGEETGYFIVGSKNKTEYTTKKGKVVTNTLTVLDAKKNKIDNTAVTPFKGSIVRFQAMAVPYFVAATKKAGISLRLLAVQVIEAVAGGEQVDTDMFDEEEGYTAKGSCNFEDNVGEEFTDDTANTGDDYTEDGKDEDKDKDKDF